MKRMTVTLSILLAVLVAVGTAVFAVSARMHHACFEVTLQENRLFGDRRAADGFSVKLEITSHGNNPAYYDQAQGGFLNWDTVYTFGESPRTETTYWFSTELVEDELAPSNSLVHEDWYTELNEENPLIARQMNEVLESGDEKPRTLILKLQEYTDTIPLSIRTERLVELYGGKAATDTETTLNRISEELREALRMPVDPEWEFVLELQYLAKEDRVRVHIKNHSLPDVQSEELETPEALYIMLSLRDRSGDGESWAYNHEQVGIYRIPCYMHMPGISSLDVAGMSQIWTAPEHTLPIRLELDPVTGHLLLLGHDGTAYSLFEIDADTGEVLGETYLGEAPYWMSEANSSCPAPELTIDEEYAILRAPDSFLTLLERGEDGRFHVTMQLLHDKEKSLFDPEQPTWVTSLGPEFWDTTSYSGHILTSITRYSKLWYEYKDGRLAVFSRRNMGCGFVVAVYEDGKLTYHAQYRSSLDAHDLAGNYECYPRVRWTSKETY